MCEAYSPIVRTFCRFRSGLTNILGVARHDVHPATSLDAILPIETRRESTGKPLEAIQPETQLLELC